MSDVVRYFICRQQSRGCYGAADALLAYNAERAAHAKEVANLRQRIAELEAQNRSLADMYVGDLGVQVQKLGRENDELKQRISDLAAIWKEE